MSKKIDTKLKTKEGLKLKEIIYIVLNIALLVLCANFSINLFLPITLQVFMIYLITFIYSKKISLISISLYVLLGTIGLPFFSGFKGGFSVYLTFNGCFIISFLFVPIFNLFIKKKVIYIIISLLYMYLFSFFNFIVLLGNYSLVKYVVISVLLPYIFIDIIKIIIAYFISKKIVNIYNKKYINE